MYNACEKSPQLLTKGRLLHTPVVRCFHLPVKLTVDVESGVKQSNQSQVMINRPCTLTTLCLCLLSHIGKSLMFPVTYQTLSPYTYNHIETSVIILPTSTASCTHTFGKGLTILKSGMQQIQRKILNFKHPDFSN